jgi:N6-adenosine-specific RNA methylase IME4
VIQEVTNSYKTRYNILYIDPPWDVKRGPAWSSSGPSEPLPYETMSIDCIKNMPIHLIAAKDAHLYLWVINKYIPEAYEIVKHWGFKPSSLLTWCKPPHGIGIGGTFVQTTEHLLFCRKGTLKANKRIDRTWFEYPRLRHSKKPNEFREMIVSASGDLPRIELFARERFDGWDSIGNELDDLDIYFSIMEAANQICEL